MVYGRNCELDQHGCVTDGPGDYGINERCSIEVLRPVFLTATQYDVEGRNYDYLTINNQRYRTSGTSQLSGVFAPTDSTITWRTDSSVNQGGFVVCAADCGCPHGTATLSWGSGATLCETSGTEDCSACEFGYQLSAAAGLGQQTCAPIFSRIVTGPEYCQFDAQGCVTDGPGDYGINERCSIEVLRPVFLTATQYDVANTYGLYDYLTINNQRYRTSGTSQLSGVFAPTNSTITWRTSYVNHQGGFVVCAADCTCPHGTATFSWGSGATLCETSGTEDCSGCNGGYQLSAAAGLGRQTCAPIVSSTFRIVTGPEYCQIDAQGCVTDGPGDYGINERCSIEVLRPVFLTATQYDVQYYWDYLTINNQRYRTSGTSQLSGVSVPTNSTITWHTSSSNHQGGFVVCAADCTCPHGTATLSWGSGATLCETSGTEDCSGCNGGYQLSAAAGLGRQTCAPIVSSTFRIVTGPEYCQIDAQGCVTDGPGDYGINELCSIEVLRPVFLTATQYDVANAYGLYDYLTINNQRYRTSGTSQLSGVFAPTNSTITWRTDCSVNQGGFVVCAADCGCPHGTATLSWGSGATLCETSGTEDCSACEFGYQLSAAAGLGRQTCAPIFSRIVTGPEYCQFDAQGCVTDGPGDYGINERCSIQVLRPVFLTATQYDVENKFDYLTINNQMYRTSGTSQLSEVFAPTNSTITWRTDYSVNQGGFVVCAADCGCPHGNATLSWGSGATLCETSGTEDCSGCNGGYQLSAAAGLGRQTCAPIVSSTFRIVTGPEYCQIDAQGCVTDGPGDYGNNELCSIEVLRPVFLTATQYDVQYYWDYLTINNQIYQRTPKSGTSQLSGVFAPTNSTITWHTSSSNHQGGFVVCAADCTCPHGTPTLSWGSDNATLCETSGTEDCSACEFGYQLSAAAGLGRQTCIPNDSEYFVIISGWEHCHIDAEGCVTDGPDDYGTDEGCVILMLQSAELNTTQYAVEDDYDYLRVDGVAYAGYGPSGFYGKGTEIEWWSDRQNVDAGFVLCAQPGAPAFLDCSELGRECQVWHTTPYCDLKAEPDDTELGPTCKAGSDIPSENTCISLVATSTGNVNTFAPVQTQCTYELSEGKLNGTCTSNEWNHETQKYEHIDNEVASLCAEFLPGPDGAPTSDTVWPKEPDQQQQLCCRPSDANLLRWLERKFTDFDIKFGQCDNCLYSVKKMVCQLACDSENKRFHDFDALVNSYEGSSYAIEAAVCEDYCEGMYLACRHVKWNDTVAYIYKNDHISFCNQALQLTVTEEALLDVNEADPSYNSFRICTTETAEGDLHCLGEGVHAQLGLTSFLLCSFITVAACLSEILNKLPTNTFIPDATVTLAVGVGFGALMKIVVVPWEDKTYGTHHTMDFSSFDVQIFSFLLLPIIIFSSAFNIEQYALSFFMMKFRKISIFAIFGSLLALLFTGCTLFLINEHFTDDDHEFGMLDHKLTLWDAMMFGSLISAVDPVATLAAFATVGIDPRVYSLIYGESILNDAVAIVAFSVFKSAKESEHTSSAASVFSSGPVITFLQMGVGSVAIGLVFGILVTFLFRFHGTKPDKPVSDSDSDKNDGEGAEDGATASATGAHMKDMLRADADGDGMITAEELTQAHLAQNINTVTQYDTNKDGKLDLDELHSWTKAQKESHKKDHAKQHKAVLEGAVFFFASLSSYYLAECLHVSGIICALVCGLICNQFAVHWMSKYAKRQASVFYITLSEISDHLILLWVGLLFYYALDTMKWKFSFVCLGLVVLSRALSVFLVGAIGNNICSDDDHDVPFKHQLMMFAAGLRGAVALALVMQMPSSSAEEIGSATLFIIVVTNVVLGGLTAPMVSLLGIPNEKNGTLDLSDIRSLNLTEREKEFARSWHDRRDRLRVEFFGLEDHHVSNTVHQTDHQALKEHTLHAAIHEPSVPEPSAPDLSAPDGGTDDDTLDDIPMEDSDGGENIIVQNPMGSSDAHRRGEE